MARAAGRSRWAVLVAGGVLAIVAAAILAVQLPTASAHAARERQVVVLHQKLLRLATQTSAVTEQVAGGRSQVTAQQARNTKLAKEIAAQRNQIAALHN